MILILLTFTLYVAFIIIYRIENIKYSHELKILNKKEYKLRRFMSVGLFLVDHNPFKRFVEKPHYQILQLYTKQRYKEKTRYFEAERLTLVILIIMGSFLIATILLTKSLMVQEVYKLSKRQFNTSTYTKQLYYEISSGNDKIEDKLSITVPEKYPNQTQINDMVKNLLSQLPNLILNGNTSLDHITKPLNLIDTYHNELIKITWESENEKLLLNDGEIRVNNLAYEGEKVVLNAIVNCYGIEEKVSYTVTIFNKSLNKIERQLQIHKYIKEQIEQSISKTAQDSLKLPSQALNGEVTIKWFDGNRKFSVLKVFVISLLISFLFYYLKAYELKVNLKIRREELLKEFPTCINKLTLLINAGMTFKRAWGKIVNDYIQLKLQRGTIILYEEMLITLEDINKGMSEIKAYETFGQRCQIPEVLRFVALVIQNIKKGSNLLISAMQQQSKEALALRQDLAKRKGEKASTKLIFPMGIMFLAVLIIIITPAIITLKL